MSFENKKREIVMLSFATVRANVKTGISAVKEEIERRVNDVPDYRGDLYLAIQSKNREKIDTLLGSGVFYSGALLDVLPKKDPALLRRFLRAPYYRRWGLHVADDAVLRCATRIGNYEMMGDLLAVDRNGRKWSLGALVGAQTKMQIDCAQGRNLEACSHFYRTRGLIEKYIESQAIPSHAFRREKRPEDRTRKRLFLHKQL